MLPSRVPPQGQDVQVRASVLPWPLSPSSSPPASCSLSTRGTRSPGPESMSCRVRRRSLPLATPSGFGSSELAAQAAVRPAGSAELARLNELAAQVEAESHPAFNIEKTKMELAGQLAAGRPAGSAELARLNELAAQVEAESHPAFNIEKTKMELAGQLAVVNEHPGSTPRRPGWTC